MKSIKTLSLAPDVNIWLTNSHQPRILHVFDHACNLINERREVLSIVTPQTGNGPFNLVVEDEVLFSEYLKVESPVSILDNQITLGDLTINVADAVLWNPRPDWEKLHGKRNELLHQITQLQTTNYLKSGLDTPFAINAQGYSTIDIQSLISSLSTTLANADISTAKSMASQLAGLGIGLTPSGDDFIVGAIYATWIIHPLDIARVTAEEITDTAAPLTTSLSAAWLKSAGKGEAGILWHNFFDALIIANPISLQKAIDKILTVGETSGADALAGFLSMFMSWAELVKLKIT